MYFDYESYRAYCYEGPVCCGLTFLLACIVIIVSIVMQAVRKKIISKDMIAFALFALGYGFVVSIAIGQLLHGGIYLRYEKEIDALEIQGEISNIKGLGLFSFPVVKGDYLDEEKNGYEFTIDGVRCKAVNKGF